MEIGLSRRRGFTLIEVVVVLLIVAIVTALAVYALGDFGRGRRERQALQFFPELITLAQQQAILQPAVLGMLVTKHGVRFYRFWHNPKTRSSAWRPLVEDRISRPKLFKNTFSLTLKKLHGYQLKIKGSELQPQIVILPGGYITPFELEAKAGARLYLIAVNAAGVTSLTSLKSS